jgi:hypothetical protein
MHVTPYQLAAPSVVHFAAPSAPHGSVIMPQSTNGTEVFRSGSTSHAWHQSWQPSSCHTGAPSGAPMYGTFIRP